MSAFRSISYDMDLFAPGRVAAGLIHMSGVAGYRKCGVLGALLRKVGRVAKSKHKAVQCARRRSARGAWSSSGCLDFSMTDDHSLLACLRNTNTLFMFLVAHRAEQTTALTTVLRVTEWGGCKVVDPWMLEARRVRSAAAPRVVVM